jgi:hypothetical protein
VESRCSAGVILMVQCEVDVYYWCYGNGELGSEGVMLKLQCLSGVEWRCSTSVRVLV